MNNDPAIYAGKASGCNDTASFPAFSRYKQCLLTEKIQESLGMPGKINLITEFSVFSASDATVF